jgi:hypothetical protein
VCVCVCVCVFVCVSVCLCRCQVVDVALGDWHSAFVCHDGEAFTCGRGIEGQLGVPDIQYCLFPQRVHSLARQGVKLKLCACGREHTLLLDKKDKLWACGNPENGRLGVAPKADNPLFQATEDLSESLRRKGASDVSVIGGKELKTWSGQDLGSASGLGGRERSTMAIMPAAVVGLPKPGNTPNAQVRYTGFGLRASGFWLRASGFGCKNLRHEPWAGEKHFCGARQLRCALRGREPLLVGQKRTRDPRARR